MKVSVFFKILISLVLCGFLFAGCGSGSGNGGDTGTGTGGGDGGDGGGGGGDSGSGTVTAILDYYSMEGNISDPDNGLFYIKLGSNKWQFMNELINNGYSSKMITYHNVPSDIAVKVHIYTSSEVWVNAPCDSVWYDASEPFPCGSFVANGTSGGVILPANVDSAVIALNEDDPANCGNSETCDVSLILRTDPLYYRATNSDTILLDDFKYAFTSGDDGVERRNALRDIENNAQGVTVQLSRSYSAYFIRDYINRLHSTSPKFEGSEDVATLAHGGAEYEVKTVVENSVGYSWISISGSEIHLNW
jgi:hypothetical protein